MTGPIGDGGLDSLRALAEIELHVALRFGLVLGMAATLVLAGLLLVRLKDRLGARLDAASRLARYTPVLTAALVLAVGLGLTVSGIAPLR